MFGSVCVLILSFSSSWAGCPTDNFCEKRFERCYKFINEPLNFFSAEDRCSKFGGHLVSIRSAYERTIVGETARSMFIGGSDYWIGASRLVSGNWSWTDGTYWSYTNWFPGEPGSLNAVSVMLGSNLWSAAGENSNKPFVCGLPPTTQTHPNECPACPSVTTGTVCQCATPASYPNREPEPTTTGVDTVPASTATVTKTCTETNAAWGGLERKWFILLLSLSYVVFLF